MVITLLVRQKSWEHLGEIVKNLMDEGATLGVSSRGMGFTDKRGWNKLCKR